MHFFGSHDSVAKTDSGIHIENIRADLPRFERVYSVTLDTRATMKVTLKTYYKGSRYESGELTQPNGKWVLFEPRAVADKILDPVLVPKIQRCVDEIFALDKEFIASKPSEFTDGSGTKWRRVE